MNTDAAASTRDPVATRLLLGVIGHVDHGKTALVRALTGMETDRLPEEQARGISIALGFAHTSLGTTELDVIDMPGHERFVRTMVSGATGIDAVLLVVAATEGIKPQTVEHVDIAALLGLTRAVIAITKADLAPASRVADVAEEVAALAARAGLVAGPPVPTSVTSGAGMAALRAAIAALPGAPAADDGFPYLPIDRAFSIAGHGTVVTGTLRRGGLSAGEELELLPAGTPVRVRALQVHGTRVGTAAPGQRVAVNLRGVELAELGRGMALCGRGLLPPASWLSVQLRAVEGAAPLASGARLRLLFGTEEVDARLRLLDRDVLEGGAIAPAQLRCATPVAVPARERFILRIASPALTVAGGRILDAETVRARRHAAPVLARLAALAAATPPQIVARELAEAGLSGVALGRLARLAGVAPARAAQAVQQAGGVAGRAGVAIARPAWDALLRRLPTALAPHPAGLAREALHRLIPEAGDAVLDDAVAQLVAAGTLRQEGGRIRLFRPAQEQARARQDAADAARLAETLRQAGLSPPDADTIAPDAQSGRLLESLIRAGVVIRAPDRVQKRDVLFHRDAVAEARRRLAPLLADGTGLLVREAGAALGISRKFSVPLLEYLDAIRFTRRVADRRVLAALPPPAGGGSRADGGD